LKKSPSHSTDQKTRTNTQEIPWKHLPYAAFALTSLQLNTGTPSLAPCASNDTPAVFSLGKGKKEWLFYTHAGRWFWGVTEQRETLARS